jgi:hypothetical protein
MDRDDRVPASTRLLGAVIVPFLVVAFGLLYWFPDDTRHWFAWDVQPTITPLIMGAGYIAGAYFFVRVARATQWHRVHVGFLPVTAFTLFMAIGTFAHLDRFMTHHVAFWIWVGLYVTTPVLVPWAWWRNRARDPGPAEPPLPRGVRPALIGAGAVQSIVALVLLLSPSTMIAHWPWLLTPLTAQTLGGWFALPGVTALMMGLDGRWSAIRITLESQLIGLALILVATARAWEDVDTGNPLAFVFVAGIAVLFAALLAFELVMVRRERAALTCHELVELVTDYFDGALADDVRAAFDAHVASCPGCEAYVEQMRATIRVAHDTRALEQRPEVTALLEAFRDWRA